MVRTCGSHLVDPVQSPMDRCLLSILFYINIEKSQLFPKQVASLFYMVKIIPLLQINGHSSGFQVILQWFDKTTTRIPESLMYSFSSNPPVPVQQSQKRDQAYTQEMEIKNEYSGGTTVSYSWKLRKLGQLVSPDNVVLNGSQYLHGK